MGPWGGGGLGGGLTLKLLKEVMKICSNVLGDLLCMILFPRFGPSTQLFYLFTLPSYLYIHSLAGKPVA